MKHKIKKIIDEWDPMDLFPGAPDDEYETEVVEINKLAINTQDAEQLAIGIHAIFNDYFSGLFDRSQEECLMIAKQILDK